MFLNVKTNFFLCWCCVAVVPLLPLMRPLPLLLLTFFPRLGFFVRSLVWVFVVLILHLFQTTPPCTHHAVPLRADFVFYPLKILIYASQFAEKNTHKNQTIGWQQELQSSTSSSAAAAAAAVATPTNLTAKFEFVISLVHPIFGLL